VFPQNLGLKQHLKKSGSIKIDGKHSMLVVPDFLIRVGKGGFFRRAARFELKTQIFIKQGAKANFFSNSQIKTWRDDFVLILDFI
jgi:hypothetical protein